MRRLAWSDVTPKPLWLNRRKLMAGATALSPPRPGRSEGGAQPLFHGCPPNSLEDITGYNNFYEFGTGKEDPAAYASGLTVDPWSIVIDGMVDKPGTYDLADLVKGQPLEERIYRFRCVEAWSMVVPWIGFSWPAFWTGGRAALGEVRGFRNPASPGGDAGQQSRPIHRMALPRGSASGRGDASADDSCDRPLRRADAQETERRADPAGGAVEIRVQVDQVDRADHPDRHHAATTWNMLQPSEYGFYANVNPMVDHPRWSQASERRIGAGCSPGGRTR
jgi:sulfoxide reductase catalytic subunit YedY